MAIGSLLCRAIRERQRETEHLDRQISVYDRHVHLTEPRRIALKARGAEFTMPPTDVPGGNIVKLNNTCGNLIQVTQLLR